MSDELYAVTDFGYRAVKATTVPQNGERLVSHVPLSVLSAAHVEQKRSEMASLLRATDWTQMADAPLTPAKKMEWGVYRQLLRDLPSVIGFPDIPWPQPPANADGAADGMPGASEPIPG